MNDQNTTDAAAGLPELSQASIDRIEDAVFAEIASDRANAPAAAASTKTRRRRRGWLTGIGIAAAFVAGVLIAPPLLNVTSTTSVSSSDMTSFVSDSSGGDADMAAPEGVQLDTAESAAAEIAGREIIASAQATVRVDDIAGAVDAVTALADAHGGYVESTDISAVPATEMRTSDSQSAYGSISIRVPSEDLTGVIDELGDTGTVISSSMSKQDVTSAAIDLRARVDATAASVERLTELMAQSGSVSELIDAEIALTDRQAQLESYTQQLAALEDQVAMSSLQVQLTTRVQAAAEPDGFIDGLAAGWNGLIVSLNALVIAVGFLLPWLAVAGVIVLVIWLIRGRRRRTAASDIP
ncbi:DUF4349 domain-containing protein [Microbacterium sp.]|uniref:DUF4349 domain-containing protein n=1 Tax=Microbacterium sp. TaxID=51671 RepID=UPI003F9C7084